MTRQLRAEPRHNPRRASALLLMAAACASCAAMLGCNSVGQGLVDHQPVAGGQTVGDLCTEPPKCELSAALPVKQIEPVSPEPLELSRCNVSSERSCTAHAGSGPGCTTWRIGATGDSGQRSVAQCTELQIVAAQPDKPASVQLRGVTLDHNNVFISAVSPLEVELDEATLQHVYFSLSGPVQLRIVNSKTFSDVKLVGEPVSSQAPRVELEHVQGDLLAVGAKEQPFDGSVSLARSVMRDSQLIARELTLQSTQCDNSLIDATTATLTDVKMTAIDLSSESAVISVGRLRGLQISSCGSLALIDSITVQSHFPGCTQEPLRIYSGSLEQCLLEGSIETDGASINDSLFGVREATDLVMWAGSLTSVSFCPSTHSLRMGGNGHVSCSICGEHTLPSQGDACLVPDARANFDLNACAALMKPADCRKPLPVRQRP
jgi:hypothetical protein